ncbi:MULTISPECIES: protein-disulfide reductase DsbD [Acetobacter]|uniref:Cytochrome C biogenesis protein n=2 Tax=Acetobacter TaxID=434 RepID=A0AAN1U8C0_9PROT|nr:MULTISPECIES: thioredoxin family protein [Acetobacter]ASL40986.1 cytochrome C biogenesis protein [Acetobacter oryzifermentans]AXM99691.1 cytochrome C biogenesis protein [Acetobacter pomorum]KAA8393740.1 cytochrome C biogenesis protein [Acetobacter sp. DmW_125124]KAA8396144.1 cytochrome C biogenesis protein [Acetobacter sp. DmW_125128]KAA8398908.1 cytochrome C biogenesis protein [Acetobacter sp. DmW_125127]
MSLPVMSFPRLTASGLSHSLTWMQARRNRHGFTGWRSGFVAILMMACVFSSASAIAAESPQVKTGHSIASLITASDTADASAPLHIALRLQLQNGWHTYWQNPGDAGDPPTITINADGALQGSTQIIHWPVPQRIPDSSLMSYAYTGDVILPLDLPLQTADQKSDKINIKAHANWLVCEHVCVPEEADLALTLNKGSPTPSAQAPLFEQTSQHMAVPSPYTATFSSNGILQLTGKDLSPTSVSDAWFMPEQQGKIAEAAEQKSTIRNGSVTLHLKPTADFSALRFLAGIVVLKDKAGTERALQINATHSALTDTPENTLAASPSFIQQMLFAFIGGIILNLMPCVFPILAMKALAITRLGHAAKREQILSASCYAVGVIGSFTLLGAIMMAARLTGAATGWGFQFQSPLFVGMVCWLLFAMALNLLGVFSFSAVSISSAPHTRHSLWNDVLTGVLAVVVASPCTAPFMGVAIAGALSGPPIAGLTVFAALGLGLALPYLLIAAYPSCARMLPRPGAWMVYLRQFLAFPLLASCVWLLWVATLEGGASIIVLLGSGMVLLGLAAWVYGLAQTHQNTLSDRKRFALHGLALLALLGALSMLPILRQQTAAPSSAQGMSLPEGVEAFSATKLQTLHASKKNVFVDMTAAWCITCLVNERVALDVPEVREAFKTQNVTLLRGDWTTHDAAITAFLRQHGRDGVPFYLFIPANGTPVTLPQVLTPGLVMKTISSAH